MLLRTCLRFQRESGSRPLTESQVQELLSVGAYAYKAANDFGGGYTITIRRDSDASEMVMLEYSDAGEMKHHYGDIDRAFSGEPRERDFIAMGAVNLIILAIRNFEKGGRAVREWVAARNQLAIMFAGRFDA